MKDQIHFESKKINLTNGFYFNFKPNIIEKSDKLILIIPDICESIDVYNKFLKKLEEKRISTVIFDLPGHGKSSGRRGGFFSEEIYKEIIKKIIDHINPKNGFSIYTSGLLAPLIISFIPAIKQLIWLRSIAISGFNFSANYKFFINILLNSIFKSYKKVNFYNYIKDKTYDDYSFKKLILENDISCNQDLKMILSLLKISRISLKKYYENLVPIFFAFGNKQKAFNLNSRIFKNIVYNKRLPIKFFLYSSGHSIHIASEDMVEKFILNYLDFLSIC